MRLRYYFESERMLAQSPIGKRNGMWTSFYFSRAEAFNKGADFRDGLHPAVRCESHNSRLQLFCPVAVACGTRRLFGFLAHEAVFVFRLIRFHWGCQHSFPHGVANTCGQPKVFREWQLQYDSIPWISST